MNDWTPTTERVREEHATRMAPHLDKARREAFDRWLEQVKAEAWDEGYGEQRECCGICPSGACPWDNNKNGPTNPYRKEQGQ